MFRSRIFKIQFLEQLLKAAMEMEEINLSQLVIYQQEEQQRKNKVKRKVFFHFFHADPLNGDLTLIGDFLEPLPSAISGEKSINIPGDVTV